MRNLILIVLLTLCAYSKAQDNNNEYSDLSEPDYKSLLKLNPVQAINGHFPILFEFFVTNKLTIELGVAATHLDYLYEADLLADPFDATQENRRGRFGYGFSGSVRYYVSDFSYAFDEWYVEAGFRSRQYYSTVRDCSDRSNDWIDESRLVNELRLIFGYSLEVDHNVVVDCFIGSGLRSQYLDRQVCIEDFSFSGLSTDPLNGLRVRPAMFMGFKVGVSL